MTPRERYEHFLQKSLVREKVVKVAYFQEQGLGAFLEKLEAQGWLDLFTNTHQGCSIPDLAEFYVNCAVSKGVVTSTVNGHLIRFDASELGEMLGIPIVGFDVYVPEDKNTLGDERLVELTQKFAQKPNESSFRSV